MLEYVLAGGLGLILGSFLNVVITREPQREALGLGRSRCPECRHDLTWYDNIPLLSYLWLQGRCRYCGVAIPWRYPLVELASALLTLALWIKFPGNILLLAYVPFALALLTLSVIDLEQGLLPDVITLPGIGFGLLSSLVFQELSFFSALVGALTGAAVFQGIAWIYAKWAGKQGMGGGDVKLLAMIGAFLGIQSLPWVIFLSASLGTLTGIILVLRKGRHPKETLRSLPIPFGPFLAIGGLFYLFGKEYLLRFLETGGLF
ncbi:prepilin peptidase [Desulfobacca acetoxidans]|uniref:Prepilin leader peptidase/N-methyltransferase n=1 Tax=Desulfobacca acetoxidans (strain ATCC 700848 / DSM 11109 / ASRB2) TaxID=880072 RepID=F2NGR5_DESAR|nr:A24 family peptidase [Desulfobacca acetoxidans]AEB08686.1 Prepilin peptidase [Desulfobacca acetoxidans DSM 11109]